MCELAFCTPFPIVGCFAWCRGRDLVLPQLTVLDSVDSPWKALPFRRSGWEAGWGRYGNKEGRGGKGNCGCYIKNLK